MSYFLGFPQVGPKKKGSLKIGGEPSTGRGVDRAAAKNFFEWPTMASFMCYSGSVNNQPAAETLWVFALSGGGRNAEAE